MPGDGEVIETTDEDRDEDDEHDVLEEGENKDSVANQVVDDNDIVEVIDPSISQSKVPGIENIKLKHFEEAFTSENWIVRIYRVKQPSARGWA